MLAIRYMLHLHTVYLSAIYNIKDLTHITLFVQYVLSETRSTEGHMLLK